VTDERHVEQILAYLREHATAYPLDLLCTQLHTQGYSQAAIDEALARFNQAPSSAPVTGETIALPSAAPAPAAAAPATPALPPVSPDLAPILAYIAQYEGTYDLRALREQLLAAGHPPALVDEALRITDRSRRKQNSWFANLVLGCVTGLPVTIGNYILMTILWSTIASAALDLLAPGLIVAGVLLIVGELVAGAVLQRNGHTKLGSALISGALLSALGIPLIIGFLVALVALFVGICLVVITGGGF
jgi:hypothetical protein